MVCELTYERYCNYLPEERIQPRAQGLAAQFTTNWANCFPFLFVQAVVIEASVAANKFLKLMSYYIQLKRAENNCCYH